MDKAGDLSRQRPPRRVTHRRKRGGRTTAVTVAQNHDLVTAGGELGGVNGGVVGFCSAVGEERLLQTSGRDLMKFFCQIGLRLIRVKR